MMKLLLVEARRALHRRAVWVLVGLALIGTAIAAVAVFFDSAGLDLARLRAEGGMSPAVMTDWWVSGSGDGLLAVAALFLVVGGLLGGAFVVGGEWRAGTVATVLTWEGRRIRFHAARLGACAALAALIAVVLQLVFLASFLPSVVAHGSAAGADGGWTLALLAAMTRIALLTALAATAGASVATVGRSTAAALAVAGGWLAVGEPLFRGWRPGVARHLLIDNATVLLTWAPLQDAPSTRSPAVALATLVAYGLTAAFLAGLWFRRSDVASAV